MKEREKKTSFHRKFPHFFSRSILPQFPTFLSPLSKHFITQRRCKDFLKVALEQNENRGRSKNDRSRKKEYESTFSFFHSVSRSMIMYNQTHTQTHILKRETNLDKYMLAANSRSSSRSWVEVKAVRSRLLDASPSSSLSSSSEIMKKRKRMEKMKWMWFGTENEM